MSEPIQIIVSTCDPENGQYFAALRSDCLVNCKAFNRDEAVMGVAEKAGIIAIVDLDKDPDAK